MTIWFVEGLPGTGKSTMAENLCSLAKASGHDAIWYREEMADHPVHPRSLTTQRRDGENYIEACLQSWSRFTEKCQDHGTVHILEGSAFQSTVRFMMEERLAGIEDYYRRFEEIVAPLNPRMVYLHTQNVTRHSQYVSELRGSDWSRKVSGYLESTPYSVAGGLTGLDGMHRFWADYAKRCDKLAAHATMPVKVIEFVPGEWQRHLTEAAEFFGLADYRVADSVPRFNTTFDAGTPACGPI